MIKDYLQLVTLKKQDTNFKNIKITSSLETYDFIKSFYFDDIDIYESFFVLMLNNSNTTISYAKISQGGITGTIVDLRIIAKYAIDSLATSVILAHNHPSGKLQESDQDRIITKKIKLGLETLDIKVLDHIILTSKGYFSFNDQGIL